MRKTLYLSFALILASCGIDLGNAPRTGDLVFVGFPHQEADSSMAGAIAAATAAEDSLEIVHVGIIEICGDSVMVIDATGKRGVSRYPLDTMATEFTRSDGTAPTLIFKRLRNNSSAKEYILNAKRLIGLPYDYAFAEGNDAYYCSELVRECYKDGDDYVFRNKPMNFKSPDGSFPEYWVKLFAKLGVPIPQGKPGTNPRDMMRDSSLVDVSSVR